MSYVVASGHVESLHNGRMVGAGELITRGVDPKHPHDKGLIDRNAIVKRVTKAPDPDPDPDPAPSPEKDKPAAEPQKAEVPK